MKQKLPATLEGILDKVQVAFEDLERQEKRLLSLLKKRNDEMEQKLLTQVQITDDSTPDEFGKFRTLKEVEVIDKLQNDTLKLVNENLRNKITLIQFYSNTILKKAEEGETVQKEDIADSNGLSQKAMDEIRQHIKFSVK